MNLKIAAVVVVVAAVIVALSTYTVDEREKAILFSLGEIKDAEIEPGLHFKMPFVNNVRKFDGRILTMDTQPERFLTSEKKNVQVDFFVKWRIENVGQYYRATGGLERNAASRLSQIMKDDLRNEFGKRTIQEAVSGERTEIMDVLKVNTNKAASELGIKVVDVRISRIDLPDRVSESVYQRMDAERQRVAADFRARGKEAAERIRANVDRERTVIIANAYRESETIRGEGDAKAAQIYAKAFGEDKEFYSLYRSLSAYRTTFSNKGDVLLLEPDSEFFRYFKGSRAEEAAAQQSAQATPQQ